MYSHIRRNRPKLRFGLRTLLISATACAIAFAIIANSTRNYQKRLRTEADLKSMGASHVGFDDEGKLDWVSFSSPVGSQRISKYKSIRHIDFQCSHVTDASIRNISRLEMVEAIHFSGCDVTDTQLKLLVPIGSLKILRLNGTKITDSAIKTIASIKGLKSVDLSGTQVTALGTVELERRCPGIVIRNESQ